MAQSAAWLVDHVIPKVPVRQWALSFPIPLRSRFAVHPELLAPASDPFSWGAGASRQTAGCDCADSIAGDNRVRMSWARLLKRVFDLDVERCGQCGGKMRIIAAIEGPV